MQLKNTLNRRLFSSDGKPLGLGFGSSLAVRLSGGVQRSSLSLMSCEARISAMFGRSLVIIRTCGICKSHKGQVTCKRGTLSEMIGP